MEVWATMDQRMTLGEVPEHARRAEALGYDGLNVPDAVRRLNKASERVWARLYL